MVESGESYKAAGVDIDLAQNLLRRVKRKLVLARRPEIKRLHGLRKQILKWEAPIRRVASPDP